MKKIKLSLTLFLTLLITLLSACGLREEKVSESVFAMDTYMQLEIYGEQSALDAVKAELERLDGLFSSTEAESDIYKLNHSGSAEVDKTTAELIGRSLELCGLTGGSLDITVYPLVEKWGFIDKNYKIPAQSEIDSLLENVDYTKVEQNSGTVTIPDGFELDLGAVAKGFAADRARDILKDSEVKSAVLNLGGTVLAYGEKPSGESWRVGVANPENSAEFVGVIECRDKTVVTSGSYERYFVGDDGKTYCHIIDPKTGYPADNGVTSVTVVSDDGTKNDALSTALFVMGAEKAAEFCREHTDFDCVILTNDKKAYVTKGLKESFSLADGNYELVNI